MEKGERSISGKQVSLAGKVHILSGSVYTTVDTLEAPKCIGLAYGLYSRAEEQRDCRVMLIRDGDSPSLVVQKNRSLHESPFWETVPTITDDPERVHRYLAFQEIVKMIRQMEFEQQRRPGPEKTPPPKKKEAKGHK